MVDPTKTANAYVAPQTAFGFALEGVGSGSQWIKAVIYGSYGTGKTTLCASAADVDAMADVLLLDIESGKATIKDNSRVKRVDRLDVIRVTSFKQLAKVHEFLKAHMRYRDDLAQEQKLIELEARLRGVPATEIKTPKRYRTVILDSLSELDQLCLYELLGISTDMKLDDALKDNDVEVADWSIFRKNNQMMQLLIRAYRDLPCNVLMVCHATYTQDEAKRMHYAPALTGKLSAQVQGFVDLVAYLIVGNAVEGSVEAPRRLFVQPVGKFDAKNRKSVYKSPYIDNPVMLDVFDLLKLGS